MQLDSWFLFSRLLHTSLFSSPGVRSVVRRIRAVGHLTIMHGHFAEELFDASEEVNSVLQNDARGIRVVALDGVTYNPSVTSVCDGSFCRFTLSVLAVPSFPFACNGRSRPGRREERCRLGYGCASDRVHGRSIGSVARSSFVPASTHCMPLMSIVHIATARVGAMADVRSSAITTFMSVASLIECIVVQVVVVILLIFIAIFILIFHSCFPPRSKSQTSRLQSSERLLCSSASASFAVEVLDGVACEGAEPSNGGAIVGYEEGLSLFAEEVRVRSC